MKTVIDAVNALKGDIKNGVNNLPSETHVGVALAKWSTFKVGDYSTTEQDACRKYWEVICTVDEFKACVDELSAATWINGISIEEWKAKMKNTVIDSHGNELEIGKVYEFSDNRETWFASSLVLLFNSEYQYKTQTTSWRFIRECQSQLGTIKKAPVKLFDGKAYQFDCAYATTLGFYDKNRDGFEVAGKLCMVKYCKNIIPLVPETK